MNSAGLTIDPVFPLWIVIPVLGLAFIFFIWKEVDRNQRFLPLRITAQLVIFISLLALALKPSYSEEKPASKILLLTRGFDKLKADSVVKAQPGLKIYKMPDAGPFANSDSLKNNEMLASIGEDILFILGEGLSNDDLDLIDSKNFKFIPGTSPLGITQILMEQPVRVNQSAVITGILKAKGNTVLRFSGLGVEDSVTLKGSGHLPFSFSIKPKQTGTFVATLSSTGPDLINEKLPIEVVPEDKLKILVLQKFPTAEVRYLKNYLAEKGHALALRYQTSRNNFKYEYANSESFRIDRLTAEILETQDLLLIDSEVLAELSSSEKNILENAVRNGLGVIFLELPEKEKTINQFFPVTLKKVTNDTVHIRLSGSKLHVLPAQPVEIATDQPIQTLISHGNRVLSGYSNNGAGKVAFQLLRETYKTRLEGNVDDYAMIWSPLIERTARDKSKPFKISLKNSFPFYTNESLSVEVISSGATPVLFLDDLLLPVMEDVMIDDLWDARGWAGDKGWHRFSIKADSTALNYYVAGNEEWKPLRFKNRVMATQLAESPNLDRKPSTKRYEAKEISPLIFYIVFLIAAGFLWLAPKI